MCSDLYLLDFLLISFIIIVIIIIIIIIILSPTSASLPPAQFRFRCLFSFECCCFSGASRPASLALVSLGLFFVCVRVCFLACLPFASSPPPQPLLSVCLSCSPFVFRRLVEKYDPTDCETEPPLQAKDFIMFRNL